MRRGFFVFLSIFSVSALIFFTYNNARSSSEFVGSDACKQCHEGYYKGMMKSIHGKKAVPGNPVNQEGCESCHGPGAQHIEKGGGKGVAIFNFVRNADSNLRDSKCLACHGEKRDLPFWNLSKHKSMQIPCDSCHSIHKPAQEKSFLKAQEPDLCFNCHKNIRAKTNKQSHHPVKEGMMKCSSCHDAMGTPNPKGMIKADSINDLCYQCHAEKRGPFAFEHPPVPENCLNCHEIHGSNHNNLLARKPPLLCQSCHDIQRHPSQPYTNLHSFTGPATSGKVRFFGRSCLNCHGNIHGSSLSETFTR